jgi:hypothetical protein
MAGCRLVGRRSSAIRSHWHHVEENVMRNAQIRQLAIGAELNAPNI